MAISTTCSSCNAFLHVRLHARLSWLASLRSRSQIRPYNRPADPGGPAELAYYWDTVPPTASQLGSATEFFQKHKPRKLWTASEWRRQNQSVGAHPIPEVVFLGRSNVGKSSLLNALLLAPLLNHVGARPGKTTTMHAWALSASDPFTGGAGPGGEMDVRLAVLDMPGYGYASRDEWGREILTYLRRRKQLRRAFVLIDAMHGPKPWDEHMVELLRQGGISYQIIVSKVDRLMALDRMGKNGMLQALYGSLRKELVQPESGGRGVAGLGEILATGSLGFDRKGVKMREKEMLGIAQVRWAVLVAAGLEGWATKRAAGTTPANDRATGNRESASPNGAGDVSTAVPSVPWRPEASPAEAETLTTPPFTQARLYNPGARTFLPAHATRSPHSSPTPASSSSLPYNPVGGLAELEVHSSFASLRRNSGTTGQKAATNQAQSRSRSRSRSRSQQAGGKEEMARARKTMGSGRGSGDVARSALSDYSSPSSSSSPSSTMTMIGGKGVGGMAELIAMSGYGDTDKNSNNKKQRQRQSKKKGAGGSGRNRSKKRQR